MSVCVCVCVCVFGRNMIIIYIYILRERVRDRKKVYYQNPSCILPGCITPMKMERANLLQSNMRPP